jgi:hypothetical protein
MWYIETMMEWKRKAMLLSLLGVVLTMFFGCATAGSPRRSLDELRSALLAHDAERAVRYIDLDSVVDCMARDIFERYEKKADSPLALAGVLVGRQAAALVMPAIKEAVRKELMEAIASSGDTGYFHDIKRASVWYLNIEVSGESAMVTPRGKSDIAFRMAKTGEGCWRIVEIIRKREYLQRPG